MHIPGLLDERTRIREPGEALTYSPQGEGMVMHWKYQPAPPSAPSTPPAVSPSQLPLYREKAGALCENTGGQPRPSEEGWPSEYLMIILCLSEFVCFLFIGWVWLYPANMYSPALITAGLIVGTGVSVLCPLAAMCLGDKKHKTAAWLVILTEYPLALLAMFVYAAVIYDSDPGRAVILIGAACAGIVGLGGMVALKSYAERRSCCDW